MILQYYIYISFFLTIAYVFIILRYIEGWKALSDWQIPTNFQPQTKVTVLIPARNESGNIQKCVQSVFNQKLPKTLFEIIVIDDHSTDDTIAKIHQLQLPNIKVLQLQDFITHRNETQSYKKKALEIGIQQSTGDLIVTTDADCIAPTNWLSLIVSFYEKKQHKFIAAPVNFYDENTLLEKFQSLDFVGMMCVTGAGIRRQFMNMCNGANLAYEKAAFYEVNGFEGINHIASGDDILLMQKMAKRYPNQVGFLKNKNATIITKAMPNLSSFINQRVRWASKSGSYTEFQIIAILALVFFFCVSIVFNFFLLPFFWTIIGWVLLFQIIIKSIIDFFFLNMMCNFFERKDLMKTFLSSQVLHILYIAVIGFLGNVKKEYQWKGRKVK